MVYGEFFFNLNYIILKIFKKINSKVPWGVLLLAFLSISGGLSELNNKSMPYPVSCLTLRISPWLLIITHQLLGYSKNTQAHSSWKGLTVAPRSQGRQTCHSTRLSLYTFSEVSLTNFTSLWYPKHYQSIPNEFRCYMVWSSREQRRNWQTAQGLAGHYCHLVWVESLLLGM